MRKGQNMRKILSIILLLALLAGCSGAQQEIILHEEESWLQEFYEADGTVHILCHLTVENTTEADKTVTIRGSSQADVKIGLLESPELIGMAPETQAETFLLKAGQTAILTVDFTGTYAGTLQKADRLLPGEIIIEEVS